MPLLRPFLAVALLVLSLPSEGAAQEQRIVQTSPSTRFERVDGPSHNTVLSLLQDREGFLWIGTADGLNRYDGYNFVVYRHDPDDAATLSHNTVQAILEAADGTIWIGTEQGLDALDRTTGRITRHRPGPDSILALNVLALFENPDGSLWIGDDGGLRWYDPSTQSDRQVEATTRVHSFTRDASGIFWLGTTQQALLRFDPASAQMEEISISTFPLSPVSVQTGGSEKVWIGVQSGIVGTLDSTTLQITPLSNTNISGEILLEDRRERLWGEDGSGLWRYDPATETTGMFVLDPTGTNALAHDVRSLYEDAAGTIWAGTLGGLYRYDARAKPFGHLSHDPAHPNSLSSNIVMAVREARDGALWIGTLGGGLNRINRKTDRITRYRHHPGNPESLCHDRVWAIHEDHNSTLWLGTDSGLCRFNEDTATFIATPLGTVKARYVNTLAEDADGYLWVGGDQVQRLNPATGTYQHFTLGNRADAPKNIQALHPTDDSTVWIGSEFKGLGRLDPATGIYTGYPFARSNGHGLPGKAVRVIFPDPSEQVLWLGTDLGLVRFDLATETFRPYLQADGLPGSVVFGILPDDTGSLWVSTNQGLARFDPAAETFEVYTATDGTGNTEYNRRAAYRNARGEMFFGGLDGVTYFAPDDIRHNAYAPPVAITGIQVSNRHTTRTINPAGRDDLILSYQDYTFAFDFAALSFTNPQKNRYAYRLDGFDRDWVDAGTRHQARYTNIPPGRYLFRVKGANEDGVWNEEGTALRLTITPPVWARWWFRMLVAVLLAGLLYAAYRYRVAQLLRVERLRIRIAGDLHDDIGSKLSSIALMSEMAAQHVPAESRERRQLTEVTQAARAMVNDLREIVWLVNPAYDRFDNLVLKMEHEAATLLQGIAYTFERPPDGFARALDTERRRHIYLMYKEILHNLAQHAHATSAAIRVAGKHHTFELQVSDDGVGFDPTARQVGNGLLSLRERARQVGGTLQIRSDPGAGTTVTLRLKMA